MTTGAQFASKLFSITQLTALETLDTMATATDHQGLNMHLAPRPAYLEQDPSDLYELICACEERMSLIEPMLTPEAQAAGAELTYELYELTHALSVLTWGKPGYMITDLT